jgi:DNA-binding NtrC family response regulator
VVPQRRRGRYWPSVSGRGKSLPVTAKALPRLLVVDPDHRTVALARDLFGGGAFEVHGLDRGDAALESLRRESTAVLLTETSLPGMDGITLIRLARRERPDLVCVVLTASPSSQGAVEALRLGVDDYVVKHGDTADHLRDSVHRALRRRIHRSETDRLMVELTHLNEQFLQGMASLQRENLELEARARPAPRQGFRVLIVDDDRPIVAVLESLLLSQPGVEVEGVYSVEAARMALAASPFDLVLSDLHLGSESGLDVLSAAKVLDPPPAVVLMTGYASVETAVQAVEQGAQGYLNKPFTDLNVVLGKVLDTKETVERERREAAWMEAIRARNSEFLSRYRLLKTKLVTLQREGPPARD